MVTLTLPWPPSVNHYWRMWRGRMLISRKGRQYRDAVVAIVRATQVKPLLGPLAIHIELFPPDARRRDVDNALKALNDSLEHGGAFVDDSQIVWLLIEKSSNVRGGKVIVRICQCGPPPIVRSGIS